ncbi:type II toxin-antitoxin system RelE/ParE family toxin [Flavobacterium qiangtangense]|uniref:Type II toxin-antitoxin system RelE/ParE family toxin n=1 Tax=Flavobacterium qiangtangense TaxID=1442595 RepID=A0ABW1PSL1_9FLAO
MEKEIIWTETALNQLREIYFYLLETSKSESIASRVTDTLFDSTEILKHSWEIYERDEMKIPKSNEYRAY